MRMSNFIIFNFVYLKKKKNNIYQRWKKNYFLMGKYFILGFLLRHTSHVNVEAMLEPPSHSISSYMNIYQLYEQKKTVNIQTNLLC